MISDMQTIVRLLINSSFYADMERVVGNTLSIIVMIDSLGPN